MTTEAADGVFIPNNADHWWVDTIDGDSTPSRITINGVEYRLVDPASTVVLDPDNPDDMQRLSDALNRCDGVAMWDAGHASNVLRSLLPVVTPPEPNGLGAVVEERETGHYWLLYLYSPHWLHIAHEKKPRSWGELNVSVVVQHGVGCSCGGPGCPGGSDA